MKLLFKLNERQQEFANELVQRLDRDNSLRANIFKGVSIVIEQGNMYHRRVITSDYNLVVSRLAYMDFRSYNGTMLYIGHREPMHHGHTKANFKKLFEYGDGNIELLEHNIPTWADQDWRNRHVTPILDYNHVDFLQSVTNIDFRLFPKVVRYIRDRMTHDYGDLSEIRSIKSSTIPAGKTKNQFKRSISIAVAALRKSESFMEGKTIEELIQYEEEKYKNWCIRTNRSYTPQFKKEDWI